MAHSALFDLKIGRIFLGAEKVINRELNSNLEQLDLVAVTQFKTQTGWNHVAVNPVQFADKLTYFRFSFERSELRYVNFWFKEDSDPTPQLSEAEHYELAKKTARFKFLNYVSFLKNEIGNPDQINDDYLSASYQFSWGSLFVSYDHQNFFCSMGMSWK